MLSPIPGDLFPLAGCQPVTDHTEPLRRVLDYCRCIIDFGGSASTAYPRVCDEESGELLAHAKRLELQNACSVVVQLQAGYVGGRCVRS